ncbi:hypothetical protein CcrC1_gp432 [Caulobacter phage C1]|nr:hypothetical protein CcrC1_gp432 [Caulobacter phage C1]UTU08661.1 hypothetical protein CcrC2_gp433 [Caulobacter phage C2]UTU09174.1 hypothetical protein CcrJ4_gp427 [Caulobacter phage J4]UTU09739.1 hypothetical protein CcrBL47_gp455 [Caulobacter phage BL47]UTU10293.1 hypothetical protein CcrRB23_gp431 [Caulobacter phage RB23]WGN97327.1 hypothetical protein [Bertelyvirus sp.]
MSLNPYYPFVVIGNDVAAYGDAVLNPSETILIIQLKGSLEELEDELEEVGKRYRAEMESKIADLKADIADLQQQRVKAFLADPDGVVRPLREFLADRKQVLAETVDPNAREHLTIVITEIEAAFAELGVAA